MGIASTRNGGLHLFFPRSGLPCSSLRTAQLDFKALGGYVLLAPSRVTPDPGVDATGVYRWVERIDFDRPTMAPLDWPSVRRFLVARRSDSKPTTPRLDDGDRAGRLVQWLSRQPEGERNRGLYWAACRWHDHQLGDPTPLIDCAIRVGLDPAEASATVSSAARTVRAS